MKTAQDPRHIKRTEVMQELFAWDFHHQKKSPSQIEPILDKLAVIDAMIEKAAPTWPINKINKIDLAIIRQAAFELTQTAKVPVKVVIDEAVELAKAFGSDSSASFVNGVLGKLIIDNNITT